MTRLVVTGGEGFIGGHVVRLLRSAGDDVTVLDLRAGSDVRDLGTMCRALDGTEVLVHLAAKVGLGVDLDDIDDYVSNNDLGTAVTLRSAAATGVRHAVVASSMVVYGDGSYHCPDHGPDTALPRSAGDLRAGRFEPRCACGAELRPGLVDWHPRSMPRCSRRRVARCGAVARKRGSPIGRTHRTGRR